MTLISLARCCKDNEWKELLRAEFLFSDKYRFQVIFFFFFLVMKLSYFTYKFFLSPLKDSFFSDSFKRYLISVTRVPLCFCFLIFSW